MSANRSVCGDNGVTNFREFRDLAKSLILRPVMLTQALDAPPQETWLSYLNPFHVALGTHCDRMPLLTSTLGRV